MCVCVTLQFRGISGSSPDRIIFFLLAKCLSLLFSGEHQAQRSSLTVEDEGLSGGHSDAAKRASRNLELEEEEEQYLEEVCCQLSHGSSAQWF